MGALVDRIRNLVVTAESPDGTVRARLAGLRSVEVRLSSGAMARHSETELSEQIGRALSEVVDGYQNSVDRLRYQGRDPYLLARDGNAAVQRQLEFQEASLAIAAVGTSTAKYVRIGWRGRSDIEVRIKPRTFTRCDRDQLTVEINSALAAVSRSRTRQILQINERFHEETPVPAGRNMSHG